MGCICGFTTGVVRVLLFVANLLFMLSGIAIAVIGIKVKETFTTFEAFFEGSFSGTSLAIIVIGSVICVIGFCGCCGAIQRSACLLQTYAVLLLGVFIAELAVGTVALTQVDDAADFVQERLDAFFVEEYQDDGASELFDNIQQKFECCGVNGTRDFYSLGLAIPVSCCNNQTLVICNPSSAYPEGCRDDVTDYISGTLLVIGVVTLSVAVSEVVAVMFACCLIVRYRDKKRLR